ncbi:hypothetical protein [Streptococcus azizii]|uniref:Phage protein n=1 Tax=Streptococcus azizii TaxID=1579424 RepID=A0AB36JK18_9STRE|nr:hypothetical protein [Streptococcus azizii]ONK25715.1 hypothetical protein BVE86_09405 [Streptococcus azizii]
MTQFEIAFLSVALMSVTWMIVTLMYTSHLIKRHNEQIDYYQHPDTQCEIARHVLKNKWYSEGGEVFR